MPVAHTWSIIIPWSRMFFSNDVFLLRPIRDQVSRCRRLVWTLLSTLGAALSLLSMLVVSLLVLYTAKNTSITSHMRSGLYSDLDTVTAHVPHNRRNGIEISLSSRHLRLRTASSIFWFYLAPLVLSLSSR